MLNQEFKEVIKLISARLKDKNIKWAVIGTANLALQGIKVKPKDLDIITNINSLKTIENLFKNFVVQPIKKKSSFVKNDPDFYELKLKIKGIHIHIIGEEKTGLFLTKIKDTKLIRLENIKIPGLSLESGIKAYSEMGWSHKVKLIKEFLKSGRKGGALMIEKLDFKIRRVTQKDREWVKDFITKYWRSEKIISRGKIHFPHKLPGFVAVKDDEYLGLITYIIRKDDLQIISLDSIKKRKGIGTSLVEKVKETAQELGCRRIWLITTNDNINALCFWQKMGFSLKTVYPNAISLSRKLKPEIPLIGNYGIPIRDEIELEMILNKKRAKQSSRIK